MRRFRLLFVVFSLALLGPLGFVVERALRSLTLERALRHQAVAERVFDEMERALSGLLDREAERPVEQYLADVTPPPPPCVIGHFEIDPDGTVASVSTAPATEFTAGAGRAQAPVMRGAAPAEIARTVGSYWQAGGRTKVQPPAESQVPGTTVDLGKDAARSPAVPAPVADNRTASNQAVSAFDALRSLNKAAIERSERQRKAVEAEPRDEAVPSGLDTYARAEGSTTRPDVLDAARAELERPPMVGRVIDARHLLLFRTVVRQRQGYHQGALLDVGELGTWLRQQGFGDDGLTAYATVSFTTAFTPAAVPADEPAFVYRHRFAEPFEGLSARLALRPLPGVGSVAYVYALSALLLATGVLGLGALYRMVSVVVSYAERRSSFVAAVTHELKTPLTAIRMYGEMLRDGMVPSDAKRTEYYRHITVESERLTRLINNVLEFSRLEKGTRTVNLTVGALAPVVREAVELLQRHVEAEGFTLHLEIDPDLPPVRFERDALLQVLFNLVDNAVKYARDAAVRQIELSCRHADRGVIVTVRDHGAGVPHRHLRKIFDPFFRGENELTRRSKGTGLGLALVRGLAERMGARVSGRNAPDGGFEVAVAFRPAR